MRALPTRPMLGGMVTACLVLTALATARAEDWQRLVADSGPYAGRSNQLAMGADGTPHIGYWRLANGVRHAWFDGAIWRSELLESPPMGAPAPIVARGADPTRTELLVNIGVSTACLGNDPVLAYSYENYTSYEPVYGPIRVAIHSGGGWSFESIPGEVGYNISIAADTQGGIHVCYLSPSVLRYAVKRAGTWQIETVPGMSGGTLGVDPAGAPHIVGWSAMGFVHIVRGPSGWSGEPIDTTAGAPSLAFAVHGEPCVAYYVEHSGIATIRYAALGLGGWRPTDVAAAGSCFERPSLAFDPDGHPRIAFMRAAPLGSDLMCARANDGPWSVSLIDSAGNQLRVPSLGISPAGEMFVSYNKVDTDILLAADLAHPLAVAPGAAGGPAWLALAGSNPVREGQPLRFTLGLTAGDRVGFEMFDVRGRRVATRDPERFAAGRSEVTWAPLAPRAGLYLVRARGAAGAIATARVIVLR